MCFLVSRQFITPVSQTISYLPEEYNVLMRIIDHLPGNSYPPTAPFASFVLNLNIRTEAHRDKKDKDVCLVLPIGEFEGGGLVMFEQGLVLELRAGDIAVFRSAETTHFNMEYSGQRASLVLQTDSAFNKWEEGRNGWADNVFFN